MAKAIDKIQLVLDLKGFSQISGLGKDFEKLKSTVKIADKDVDEFVISLRQLRKETKLIRLGDNGKTATGQKAAVIDVEPSAKPI